jgi:hypothetical protein
MSTTKSANSNLKKPTDASDSIEEKNSTTSNLSELKIIIHSELSTAVSTLNKDISARFDSLEYEFDKIFNSVRSENKYLKAELNKITSSKEIMHTENLQLKSELKAIRSLLIELKTNPIISQVDTESKNSTIMAGAKQFAEAVKSAQKEDEKREERKCNVKITGLPKKTDCTVNELFNELFPNRESPVIQAKRFTRPNKTDIVIATVKSVVDRNDLLSKSYKLRETSQFSSTYMSLDLTPEQETEQFHLRAEKKD